MADIVPLDQVSVYELRAATIDYEFSPEEIKETADQCGYDADTLMADDDAWSHVVEMLMEAQIS